MVLFLTRTYFCSGTNGTLYCAGQVVCHTIELHWNRNTANLSCIPEGEYQLAKRYSRKYGWHVQICDVPNRSLILFHPANHAGNELRGCIAPVTKLSGSGIGLESVKAFQKLQALVYGAFAAGEKVSLFIHS